jgi:hypothetical protein
MAITTNDYAHSVCRLLRKHTSNHWIDVLRLVSKRNIVTIPQIWFRVRISVNVTAHFANNVTGGFTRLRGV